MTVVRLRLNGEDRTLAAAPQARLLDVLRDDLGLKATRFGCGLNQCGACHVLVDGRAQAACDTPLWAVEGKSVITVEGFDAPGVPPGLREAFVAEQALQCGYCTSGMLVAAAALLLRNPEPTADEVRQALDGNLCRCGAHNRIVRAVLRAAAAA
ncbi:MAG TPA: 2Fe-2S iron-sulfur cluster-binding protein [Ramlibacter sp.]